MNVYFVNPTYVKPEAWKPLLSSLKVKAAYSFLPKEDLPKSLYSIIKPYLKASYSNQDKDKFEDSCVFWLRAHFEKHIRLITDDFEDVEDIPEEERIKYSSRFALNNLKHLDEENCLILLYYETKYEVFVDYSNYNVEKIFYVDNYRPKHIANYCLNILHKKYGHNQYREQSSFVLFDEFFYRTETLPFGKKNVGFLKFVYDKIRELAPNDFPIREVNGRQRVTPIITGEGVEKKRKLLKDAEDEYEAGFRELPSEPEDFNEVVEKLNEAFWRECGEGGSNCESWPGWG